jgi:proteasome assembly chaperone (PAC2) family protein
MDSNLVIENIPELNRPIAIVGFAGWPNGGNLAIGLTEFLVKHLKAERFATIAPDTFYRFDDSRPGVRVKGGRLEEISPPEAAIYAAHQVQTGVDVILFKGDEPQLRWFSFVDAMLSCCKHFDVPLIISLGGLQDNVAHTDVVISGLASSQDLLNRLKENEVVAADYQGPGAIHSLILQRGKEMGIDGISLWGHCPFYLQGTHLKLLCTMADVLANLMGLELDTTDLEKGWEILAKRIQHFVDGNPELQKVIQELVDSEAPARRPGALRKDGNVIYLDRFPESEDPEK